MPSSQATEAPRAARASAEKLPKIDFLRAVSAGIVVLYHYGVPGIPASFGVLTFFVISGFLITHLLLREQERTGNISLGRFYIRRSLRIFPAFYVYWLLVVADAIYRHRLHAWLAPLICSFFYVNNYYQGLNHYPYSLVAHSWSLGVEEQFYLLWPGIFLLLRRRLIPLTRSLAIAIPCFWVMRAAMHFHGVDEAYINTAFETRIDAILAGCLLALVLHTGVVAPLIARLRRPPAMFVVLALLGLSLFKGAHYGIPYRNVIGFAVEPVLVALLILQLTSLRGLTWMDARPLSYLGRISYSTYLYQEIVIPALKDRIPHPFNLIGCVLAVWITAALSFELIEKPFLKLKRRFETVHTDRLEPTLPRNFPVDA